TISTPKANTTYTIDPLTPELKGKSYRIQSDYNANEYYILENRAKTGWDAYLPASGLQVTHVYYNATRWDRNTVNNYNTQGMTIIPADNLLKTVGPDENGDYSFDYANQVGDLFPYKGVNELTDVSTPAATLYVGGKMGKPITDISKSGTKVTFTYMPYVPESVDAPVANEVGEDDITSTGFTASWNSVSGAVSYVLKVIKAMRLVNETFAKCTAASSTAISSMDKYADVAGWRASTVYPEVGGVRLGNSSKVGYLRTPDLDLSESGGEVIIAVKAKAYNSDTGVELQVYLVGNTEGAQTVTLSSEEREYILVFTDVPQEAAQSFTFANTTKAKRAVIAGVNLTASGEAPIDVTDISATQYDVTGLKGSTEYLYMVKAVGAESESTWSNTVFVTTKPGQVTTPGDVNGDGIVSGADVTALYNVLLDNTTVAGDADVNGDGVVSGADVTALYNILLGS
ncbi:MAG: hypothetical protein J6X70_11260, partial [Muribaculaceae bacterium]|nr:hypothetical protein [Muribaculaceae bacterium]